MPSRTRTTTTTPEGRATRVRLRTRAIRSLVAVAALALLPACGAPEREAAAPSPTPAPSAAESLAHERAGDDASPSPAVGQPGGPHAVDAEAVTYGEAAGTPIRGYLARPRDVADPPGVLLVHEWWGLNDTARELARQLASHGYLALAVDLYLGRTAERPKQAMALVQSVLADPGAAEANLRQAAAFLRERGARRVGVVGWSFGGDWALRGGMLLGDELDAVVMYYGEPTTAGAELARLNAPLLGLFGAEDATIPVANVREMEATLKRLGKPVTIRVFPGARHAFANPSGKRYVPEAAEEAWRLTLEFLDRHLRSG
jgi:carboxymethylenebutenolidase